MSIQTVGILFSIIGGIVGGVIALGGFLVAIGRKYQMLDHLEENMKEIKGDVKNILARLIPVEERLDILWKDRMAPTHSPRQLNEHGATILEESGIKQIIEAKKDELLSLIRASGVNNPYDAEELIEKTVQEIPTRFPNLLPALKEGAYRTGGDISSVLFVGSIYLRNLIFPELGFDGDDNTDPPTPSQGSK